MLRKTRRASTRARAHRLKYFCGRCGISLTYQHADAPEIVEATSATLDDPNASAPTREVFTTEKLAWKLLKDGLERYRQSSAEGPKN